VPARYDLAREFREVRDSAKYGDNAVGKLAGYVGRSKVLIHGHITVVEVWPDKEKFLDLAKQHDEDTKPLAWSHWMKLAKVEGGRERGRLVRLAKKNGWEAAKLELKRGDGGSQSNETAKDTKANAKASKPLQAATQNVSTQIDTLKGGSAGLMKKLPAEITKAKPTELNSALEELRLARTQLGDMCDALDQFIGQLEERQKLEAKKRAKSRKATAGTPTRAGRPKRRTAA
jgi:hypothetical protein